MIISGDWIEAPYKGEIRQAEVVDTLTFSYKGSAEVHTIVICRDVDTGEQFTVSEEACVEIDKETI